MNKILALVMLSMVAITPMAAAFWTPDFDDFFDFGPINMCNSASDCGTSTDCTQYACTQGMLGKVCQMAYAPSGTSTSIACQICDGSGGTTIDTSCFTAPFPCDDGNACTINDMSISGFCMGAPKNCDDSNSATTDTCNTATGCSNILTNTGSSCNDYNACTINDQSGPFGACFGTYACNDNNALTTDTCDVQIGCSYTPIPQEEDEEVPEFSSIAAGVALIGSIAGFAAMRRRK
jgi:hypothetical protein